MRKKVTQVIVVTKERKIRRLLENLVQGKEALSVAFTEKLKRDHHCDVMLLDETLFHYYLHEKKIHFGVPIILMQFSDHPHAVDRMVVYDSLNLNKITYIGFQRAIDSALRQYHIIQQMESQKKILDDLVERLSLFSSENNPKIKAPEKTSSLQKLIAENELLLKKAKEKSKDLENIARHDILTNLPNRYYFNEYLTRTLAHVKRHGHILGLLLIDLDKFKVVNDTYGHRIGDLILVEVAKRIQSSIRKGDFIARVGGDEFAMIIHEISTTHAAGMIAWKLLQEIDKDYIIEGKTIHIGASIGISFYPLFGSTEKELLEFSDIALYQAKRFPESRYCYASSELQKTHSRWMYIEKHLARAFSQNELRLMYQPIYHLSTKQLYGFEVILKWYSPEGEVPLDEFIPVAETTGVVNKLIQWTIDIACKQIVLLSKGCDHNFKYLINLPFDQLDQGKLVHELSCAIDKCGLNPKLLQFEITEMAVFYQDNAESKKKLYHFGVSQGIDNVKANSASSESIKYLPISMIKIDKTFISSENNQMDSNHIIDAIVLFAKKLNLETVVEGIESETQMDYLISKKCAYGQGPYFSEGLSFSAVKNMIAAYASVVVNPKSEK